MPIAKTCGYASITAPELARLHEINGFFVGLLTEDEIDILDRAEQSGLAYRSYEGSAGFLGLAKVRVR